MKSFVKFPLVALTAALAILATGCTMGKIDMTGEGPLTLAASTSANGKVMGGQQPVAGVALTLYTVGTTGYGSAATALTGGTATTTVNGNFGFGTVTCPTPSSLVYLVGTGGYPIAAVDPTPAVHNVNLTMMVGLGTCSTMFDNFINMNEVTTVATIWALSPFMTGPANIGSSATNATGIVNAFATINNLVDTSHGTMPGLTLPAGATIPTAEINSLADAMEQCVNSGGLTASDPSTTGKNGSNCGNLFYYAQVGANSPTDTATAMMNIAQHPATQVAGLNQLRSASPVFVPALDVNYPPSDWTIAISYTGGGLNTPQGIATDATGNVWVANSGNSSVSEFSPSGLALSPTTGYTGGSIATPYALAVDPGGNVWVANATSVTELNGATGASIINVPSSVAAPIASPNGIAIDGSGDVYIANTGANSVSLINNAGVPVFGSLITSGLDTPAGIAISPK
ncbi:MAG: hypothetical protein ABI142_03390 [Bryocella sp.]